MVNIRPYQEEDQAALVEIIGLNIPEYFAPEEKKDFIKYLELHREDYFVLEKQGRLIGSGGVNYFPEIAQARISWDIIHPDFQGQGLGKKILLYRVNHIIKQAKYRSIMVRTSQLAYAYYEKFGFQTEKISPDFWAKGLDLYQMIRNLD